MFFSLHSRILLLGVALMLDCHAALPPVEQNPLHDPTQEVVKPVAATPVVESQARPNKQDFTVKGVIIANAKKDAKNMVIINDGYYKMGDTVMQEWKIVKINVARVVLQHLSSQEHVEINISGATK